MVRLETDAVGRLVRDALIDRARDGVKIRVLYDDVGCWKVPHDFDGKSYIRHIHINHGPELERSIDAVKEVICKNENIRSK